MYSTGYHIVSDSSSKLAPSPTPTGECVPPPLGSWGETFACVGRGGGGANSDDRPGDYGTLSALCFKRSARYHSLKDAFLEAHDTLVIYFDFSDIF